MRAAFTQGMHDLGWLEGKNIEYRFVHAVGAGFVASLARPGGNITGFTSQQEEVVGKLIGILHEVVPSARRIAILLNESYPSHAVFWAAAQSACAALDLVALRAVASAPAQLGAAVEQIVRQQSQAVVVIPDGMFLAERAKLQELMQTARLPVAYARREHVIAGGLLSYGADLAVNYRNAAKYVDKILKGAKPADRPVEQATKFDLVINSAPLPRNDHRTRRLRSPTANGPAANDVGHTAH